MPEIEMSLETVDKRSTIFQLINLSLLTYGFHSCKTAHMGWMTLAFFTLFMISNHKLSSYIQTFRHST